MKTSPINVKVVGCGGIGGMLLPTLCRFLNYATVEGGIAYLYPSVEMTLIDGDAYEPRNAERQAFSNETNKAQETVDSLAQQFSRINFRAKAAYLTRDNVVVLIREGDVVFSCVDNHATRKLLNDRCCELKNVTLISGGNGYTDGNIQVHNRKGGVDITLPIANEYHPEIVEPTDENPGDKVDQVEAGCQELAAVAPQLIITNNSAAARMLDCFYAWTQGKVDYDEVYFDVVSNQARKVKRRKEPAEV